MDKVKNEAGFLRVFQFQFQPNDLYLSIIRGRYNGPTSGVGAKRAQSNPTPPYEIKRKNLQEPIYWMLLSSKALCCTCGNTDNKNLDV
jgi:hypothetical protein